MDKISDFIERLDKIIKAYEKCNEADSCEGCPYDGICATKAFALESDAADLLEDIVCSFEFDEAVCDDICGTDSAIRDWIANMQCGRIVDDEDGVWGGVLCLTPEMEHDLVTMLKQVKDILEKMQ